MDWRIEEYMFGEEYAKGIPIMGDKKIESTVKGIVNTPVFDKEYFHEGDVVTINIRVTDCVRKYWRNLPEDRQYIYAIVVNVLADKLIISYYNKGSKNNTSTFAIPVEMVVKGYIEIKTVVPITKEW